MRIVSNETRDKLKKMGLSTKTMFSWYERDDKSFIDERGMIEYVDWSQYPVYDLSFLVEALPYKIFEQGRRACVFTMGKDEKEYRIGYLALHEDMYYAQAIHSNPAEAAAQLLIYIVEQGYAEIKNGKVVAV